MEVEDIDEPDGAGGGPPGPGDQEAGDTHGEGGAADMGEYSSKKSLSC